MIGKFTIKTTTFGSIMSEEIRPVDLFYKRDSAFIVKNFFPDSVIRQIKDAINRLTSDRINLHNNMGYIYPATIYLLDSLGKVYVSGKYQKDVRDIINAPVNKIGLDFSQFITQFSLLFNPATIKVPTVESLEEGLFTPVTMRCLNPDHGEMSLHCEKDLKKIAIFFYQNTGNQIDTTSIVSFFIMIQKPSRGGLFSVYDIEFSDVKQKISNTELKLDTNKTINIERDLIPHTVQIDEGDMFMFNGGDVWHRTEIVYSNLPRITIGGFLAKDLHGDNIYIWS